MNFISPELEQYAGSHTSPESELLSRINRETHLEVLQPRMLSGHLQGRVLSLLSSLLQPKRILEIGTYTGYSALCLAEGLPNDGKLITIDVNEELQARVQGYFNDSNFLFDAVLLLYKGGKHSKFARFVRITDDEKEISDFNIYLLTNVF